MSVYVIYVACIITILYYIALDHIVLYYAVLLSFFAITWICVTLSYVNLCYTMRSDVQLDQIILCLIIWTLHMHYMTKAWTHIALY